MGDGEFVGARGEAEEAEGAVGVGAGDLFGAGGGVDQGERGAGDDGGGRVGDDSGKFSRGGLGRQRHYGEQVHARTREGAQMRHKGIDLL